MTFIKNKSLLSFFLTFTFLLSPSMAMEENDQNIPSFVLAKKDEPLPTQKKFENITGLTVKTLILYKQISSLNEMVEKLQQKMNPLIQENENLNKKICELQEKTKPFKPLKAVLKNNPLENNVIDSWTPYDDVNAGAWKPMRFDAFEGDEFMKVENLSAIKIPENGVYSLFSHYCWHSIAKNNEGKTAAYTSISINEPSEGFKSYHFAQHHLVDTYVANDCLNRVTYLNKGDRVMLSIKDHPNTEYSKSKFQLKIERIY